VCLQAAQSLRESVDVTRLSRIALHNLEREGEGADYAHIAQVREVGRGVDWEGGRGIGVRLRGERDERRAQD
jgi:hypothetical protein